MTDHFTAATLLTPDQLAERWQCQRTHIYRLAREGKLGSVKLGRLYRFRLADIEDFEATGGTAA